MMSVPNHQPPLSGNSWPLAAFFFLLVTGCGIFAPASKDDSSVDTTRPGRDVSDRPVEVDTIEWTQVPEEISPPITERREEALTEFKSVYNVVLIAPFDAARFQYNPQNVNARMSRMMEFYAGLKFGLNENAGGPSIHLSVVDSQRDKDFADRCDELAQIREADIIIGPYFSRNIDKVARYAREEGKVLISPWNTSASEERNPLFVQMRPGLERHVDALVQDARMHYEPDELILMTKNDPRDMETMEQFQAANRRISGDAAGMDLPQLIVDDIGDPAISDQLNVLIAEDGVRSVLLNNWSDQPFVISALAKINFAKADEDVTVYGFPQWMTMSGMDFDYLENLEVHISSGKPVNFDDDRGRALRDRYFNSYGDLPTPEVYYGYDLMRWTMLLLEREGSRITNGLLEPVLADLHHTFEFTAVYGADGESVHHYENQFIRLYRFKDYNFEPADGQGQ